MTTKQQHCIKGAENLYYMKFYSGSHWLSLLHEHPIDDIMEMLWIYMKSKVLKQLPMVVFDKDNEILIDYPGVTKA